MKNDISIIGKLKYKHRFFFTSDYLLKKVGINFTNAYIFSINLDDFVFEKSDDNEFTIKECNMDDLDKFGELKDLFLSDMEDGHILVAAFLEDQWIGYNWISLKPIEVEEVERVIHFEGAYIYRGFVKNEFRKRGLFKELLYFSLNLIKNKYNKNKVYGITETANIPTIKALERNGYSKVGIIKYSRILSWKKYEEKIDRNNSVTLLEV
jgi:ribosomal protein S18 acetylase RimI-like enzyme